MWEVNWTIMLQENRLQERKNNLGCSTSVEPPRVSDLSYIYWQSSSYKSNRSPLFYSLVDVRSNACLDRR